MQSSSSYLIGGLLGCGVVVAGVAIPAQATLVMEFTEHHVAGSYDGSTSFNAVGAVTSFAEVSRFVPTTTTASFTTPPGMSPTGGGGLGGFHISLSVIGSGPTRTGTGTFVCTDITGADTISGSISGSWAYFSATDQIHFDGQLSGIVFTGPNFLGNNGSVISLTGLPPDLNGALVSLTTAGTGGFFNSAFSGADTGVDGQILTPPAVPLPPAVWTGAGALSGLAIIRRPRRR
jgi:hypothetical protein